MKPAERTRPEQVEEGREQRRAIPAMTPTQLNVTKGFFMCAQSSSSSDKSAQRTQGAAARRDWDKQKPGSGKPLSGDLRDPHPERMKNATVDNLDDTMISGKADAGISGPGPARSPGSEH
jgi:hypothetical protein